MAVIKIAWSCRNSSFYGASGTKLWNQPNKVGLILLLDTNIYENFDELCLALIGKDRSAFEISIQNPGFCFDLSTNFWWLWEMRNYLINLVCFNLLNLTGMDWFSW